MILADGGVIVSKEISTQVATTECKNPSYPTEEPTLKDISKVVDKIAVSDKTPDECCEEAGLTLKVIYKKLAEMMEAESVTQTRYGEVRNPDNRVQMAAVQLALELRKHIKDKQVVTQVGIFNDPKTTEEAQRVLALRDRMGMSSLNRIDNGA